MGPGNETFPKALGEGGRGGEWGVFFEKNFAIICRHSMTKIPAWVLSEKNVGPGNETSPKALGEGWRGGERGVFFKRF